LDLTLDILGVLLLKLNIKQKEKIIKSLLLIEYGLTRKSMALSEKDKQVILN